MSLPTSKPRSGSGCAITKKPTSAWRRCPASVSNAFRPRKKSAPAEGVSAHDAVILRVPREGLRLQPPRVRTDGCASAPADYDRSRLAQRLSHGCHEGRQPAPGEVETVAAQRLLLRVLENYPRFFDAMLADAAYLQIPFLRFCLKHRLDVVAILKKNQLGLLFRQWYWATAISPTRLPVKTLWEAAHGRCGHSRARLRLGNHAFSPRPVNSPLRNSGDTPRSRQPSGSRYASRPQYETSSAFNVRVKVLAAFFRPSFSGKTGPCPPPKTIPAPSPPPCGTPGPRPSCQNRGRCP
ncbi:MAG: hypothetical protein BWX69_02199 [Planctomycetes bacterium ADurb.Bin069]|nr:MAG: hypothetical protein BWX69_02199 [Planctomycetes bacterium ADurb.Bin069]